ncbi:hypothetical protein Bca4012_065999 [Brassica carinata]|uniref:Uncharacterized protein n=1 Tax=Brassica carinata TaxID=52824 RepID=A0A8X7VPI5_BRACI|nr:hypothetical protein Bca52824_018318 [Brassica carinata]
MALFPVAELADFSSHRCSPFPGFNSCCQFLRKDSPVFTSDDGDGPPIATAGSAQSEFKLNGSTRLSTAIDPPLLRYSVSPPVRVKPERGDLPLQHFVFPSDERPEAETHRRTTAPLGLDESYESRYSNIGVLFLRWISVCAPLWILANSIVSPRPRFYYTPGIAAAPSQQDFLTTISLLRLHHTMPSQASMVLHKAGVVTFPISSSLELLCMSVDLPDLLTTSPMQLHHSTPVSSIDGSSHSHLCDLQIGVFARITNHPEAFYPLSDVFPHTFWLNECDDRMLRALSATNYWARHGNVEIQGLKPIRPSSLASNFTLSASLEVKLELEIHLVSSVSFVGFKAVCACFSVISSHIGLLGKPEMVEFYETATETVESAIRAIQESTECGILVWRKRSSVPPHVVGNSEMRQHISWGYSISNSF